MIRSRFGRSVLTVLVAVLLAWGWRRLRATPPGPECQALIEKILQCDPAAPASLRDDPGFTCPDDRLSCAKIDTAVAGGCAKFEGCLYDGD